MLWNVMIGSILHGKTTSSDSEASDSEEEKPTSKVNA